MSADSFLDFPEETPEEREKREENQMRFAQRYLVFETNEQARAIMEYWEETFVNRPTPVEAPIQVYAADQALRSLVIGIKRQIKLAKEGIPE